MANILNVGPIVPVDKGVYSSATTYSILNLVDDGTGQVYLSKKNNNLGNNLTNGEWWGRYTGPQGPQGVKGDTGTINLAGEYGTSENVGLNQKFLTEKMAGFEEVVQTQLITTPPATLNAQVGYYYCMGGSGVVVDTMTIQLPAIADKNKTKNVQFFMTMGSAPEVTFVSAGTERILYQKDFALEAERSYEVNALWNGHAWVITVVEIIVPFFAKLSLNNGEVVELQGSGELTEAMVSQYKSSVVRAEIGKSCTSIGGDAFVDCSGLTSITIPDSVTSIGRGAFIHCYGLTSITCNATTAPTIDSTTFQNVKTGGTLTVPVGSTGYDVWMSYLGNYNWTKVEQ